MLIPLRLIGKCAALLVASATALSAQIASYSARLELTHGKSFDTRSWFHPCLEDAGITGYVWHSNRHTFCSWLAMAGASIKEIQEAAGHKSIIMSARYSHLSPAHKLSVVERIASISK